jgi:NhaP-type Na+/H+ or K+/H+ antiporter
VRTIAEVALFAVLFTDGMRVGAGDLASAWRLPGRALVFGLPLTLICTAVAARFLGDLPWGHAFLVGAVLSPTDPVFAAALVGREGVPRRLSHLLNVESGLNDGLALPIVVALLATVGDGSTSVVNLAGDLALGVTIGVIVPLVAIRIEETRFFLAASDYEPLYPFAIGLLIFALTSVVGANLFLAAFAAGVTVATVSERFKEAFHRFGDLVSELLKLAAVLIFAALISPEFLSDVSLGGYLFAIFAVALARPIALLVSFLGSGIDKREWVAAAWFGPKGFASVVYGLLILESGVGLADKMFHLVAIAVALSIVAHSSTDVAIARRFRGVDIGPV